MFKRCLYIVSHCLLLISWLQLVIDGPVFCRLLCRCQHKIPVDRILQFPSGDIPFIFIYSTSVGGSEKGLLKIIYLKTHYRQIDKQQINSSMLKKVLLITLFIILLLLLLFYHNHSLDLSVMVTSCISSCFLVYWQLRCLPGRVQTSLSSILHQFG